MTDFSGKVKESGMSAYFSRLIGALKLALDGTKAEEMDNPHTILGIPTRVAEVTLMFTLFSAIGINTLTNIVMR